MWKMFKNSLLTQWINNLEEKIVRWINNLMNVITLVEDFIKYWVNFLGRFLLVGEFRREINNLISITIGKKNV